MNVIYDFITEDEDVEDEVNEDDELFAIINAKWGNCL